MGFLVCLKPVVSEEIFDSIRFSSIQGSEEGPTNTNNTSYHQSHTKHILAQQYHIRLNIAGVSVDFPLTSIRQCQVESSAISWIFESPLSLSLTLSSTSTRPSRHLSIHSSFAAMTTPVDPRTTAVANFRKKFLEHRECETRLKKMRADVKQLNLDYDKTEEDLKAVQNAGQIIAEVLKRLDEDRCKSTAIVNRRFGRHGWRPHRMSW